MTNPLLEHTTKKRKKSVSTNIITQAVKKARAEAVSELKKARTCVKKCNGHKKSVAQQTKSKPQLYRIIAVRKK